MKLESVIVQSMDEFHVYYSSKMDKNLQWTAGITLKSKKKKKKIPIVVETSPRHEPFILNSKTKLIK